MVQELFGAVAWLVSHPWAGVPVALAGWCVFVQASPYRKCRWCAEGTRRRKRGRRCFRCRGHRIHRRLLARQVAKVVQSIRIARSERGDD